MSQPVVIGITPLDVHEAAEGPRPVNAVVRRRTRSRRVWAGLVAILAGAALFGAAALGWAGEVALGLALIPASVALGVAAWRIHLSAGQLAEIIRDGLVVPARIRVVRGPEQVELCFTIAGRHPAWHQLFPPHEAQPVTLMLSYEVDGREYLAMDVIEPGERVACVSRGSEPTPAVLVRRERPDRPVILTEQVLYAPV